MRRLLSMGSVLDAVLSIIVACEFGVEGETQYFGYMFMFSVLLLICRFSLILYFAGSGVKRVHVVFSVSRIRLFRSASHRTRNLAGTTEKNGAVGAFGKAICIPLRDVGPTAEKLHLSEHSASCLFKDQPITGTFTGNQTLRPTQQPDYYGSYPFVFAPAVIKNLSYWPCRYYLPPSFIERTEA